jgi:cytochrome b involved in lipid metabolism
MDLFRKFTRQISFQSTTVTHQIVTSIKLAPIQQFSLKEVATHCTIESCWMVICDKVYDLTDFIEYHPGGYEICMEYAGSDATNAFNEKPHTIDAVDMLEKYYIGELIKEDRMFDPTS